MKVSRCLVDLVLRILRLFLILRNGSRGRSSIGLLVLALRFAHLCFDCLKKCRLEFCRICLVARTLFGWFGFGLGC